MPGSSQTGWPGKVSAVAARAKAAPSSAMELAEISVATKFMGTILE